MVKCNFFSVKGKNSLQLLKCHMFTCVPTSSMRLLGWARLHSHHRSGRANRLLLLLLLRESCRQQTLPVPNKQRHTAVGQQSWPPACHTHTQMHTLGRCCRGYSVCAHSGIHTHVQLFTCALHCSYQMLDHRSCTRRKVVSWKITNTLWFRRRFCGFCFLYLLFHRSLLLSVLQCHVEGI